MMKLLKKKAILLQVYIWGSVAFISNLILKLWTVPQIRNKTDGFTSFDLSIKGYNLGYAMDYINRMDEMTINFYSHVQIPIDFIFPISTAIFSLFLLKYFSKKIIIKKIFFILPVLCCLFDLSENIFIYIMLNLKLDSTIVMITSSLTQLKFLTGIVYALFMIYLFIKYRGNKS